MQNRFSEEGSALISVKKRCFIKETLCDKSGKVVRIKLLPWKSSSLQGRCDAYMYIVVQFEYLRIF